MKSLDMLFDTIFRSFDEVINSSFDDVLKKTREPLFESNYRKFYLGNPNEKAVRKEIENTEFTKKNSTVYGVKFDIDKYEWDSTAIELNGNKLSVEAHKRNGENIKEKNLCIDIPSDVDKSTMRKRWDTDNHKLIVTFLRGKK
jgi:hypothetical protein